MLHWNLGGEQFWQHQKKIQKIPNPKPIFFSRVAAPFPWIFFSAPSTAQPALTLNFFLFSRNWTASPLLLATFFFISLTQKQRPPAPYPFCWFFSSPSTSNKPPLSPLIRFFFSSFLAAPLPVIFILSTAAHTLSPLLLINTKPAAQASPTTAPPHLFLPQSKLEKQSQPTLRHSESSPAQRHFPSPQQPATSLSRLHTDQPLPQQ